MKKIFLIIGVIIVLIIAGFLIYSNYIPDYGSAPTGQRDIDGCWSPSDEHWCATQNKCLENTEKCETTSADATVKTIIAKLNQKVIITPDLSITPRRVKNDTRCTDICTSPGTVIVSISFNDESGATVPIILGTPFILRGYEVKLINVLPQVRQDRPLLPEEYSFEFLIK
jgi:hypothetical protein